MTNDGFIKVNQSLETSIENVLAVGDISKYPLAIFNLEYVNCQHWQMACSTGHQAGMTRIKNKFKRILILISYFVFVCFVNIYFMWQMPMKFHLL